MKQFKLVVHQKNFSEDSLIINPKDFPSLKIGDVVEIYLPEDEYSRLLLQVTCLREDFQQKDTISIEQSIASSFQLRTYADVIVNIVNPKDVALDSVELTFKDQYLARSDMWRLKKCLVNTCVYPNKKIEFHGTRCQVFEMWAQGERVACGVVTDDTKVVYRSCSSMVYLFIQMSTEMWDFDMNGDLYFEKAVNGFLSDLFAKWKALNCNHDVTIVLFSRTYYEAQSIEEFPNSMRECLQQDYKGRFYEDFYRVAVQNERYEDWSPVLILLKKLFNQYQDVVLKYHQRSGLQIPRAVNSTSSKGNFLEVLNMALNVFEKHYMDRSFDRTGQLSVVISPGVGVFEVDRELTNITKQRIIDNGIGSDLVCLGEQPLHAVPLFKFCNKHRSHASLIAVDDYNMPHWINLSFYSTSKHVSYSNFIPRIKLPTPLPKSPNGIARLAQKLSRVRHVSQPDPSFPSLFDYDEYDKNVFKVPVCGHGSRLFRNHNSMFSRRKSSVIPASVAKSQHNKQASDESHLQLTTSDQLPCTIGSLPISSGAIFIPKPANHSNLQHGKGNGMQHVSQRIPSKDDIETEFSPPVRAIVGSAESHYKPQAYKQMFLRHPRALVNPFDPSHVTIKLTSNRRRWTHVFPLGPTGIFMQQHHYQAVPQNTAATLLPCHLEGDLTLAPGILRSTVLGEVRQQRLATSTESRFTKVDLSEADKYSLDSRLARPHKLLEMQMSSSGSSLSTFDGKSIKSPSLRVPASASIVDPQLDRSLTWLWGATGEQEWTPALTTGVDWKSLVIPACLPITTDYFPDQRSLQNDYVVSDYFLLPEDISIDLVQRKCYRGDEDAKHHKTLPTPQMYHELVCQRLQQGFQIIVLSKPTSSLHPPIGSSPQYMHAISRSVAKGDQQTVIQEEHLMSIGRIFHKLTLEGPKITVIQYRPRHPYPTIKIHYCYRFRAPDNDTYGISWVDFASEKLETYNWNYMDHYICVRGEGEFELKDAIKFWRLRLLLLPGVQAATRRIIEASAYEPCNLYTPLLDDEIYQQQETFLKFLEVMNRIRRPASSRKNLATSRSHARRFSVGPAVSQLQSHGGAASAGTFSPQLSSAVSGAFRERVGSNRVHDRPRPAGGSRNIERMRMEISLSGRVSPATEADGKLSGSNTSLEATHESSSESQDDTQQTEVKVLTLLTPPAEIVEAMKHSTDGLSFLSKQTGLPPYTFISGEAVAWAKERMEDVPDIQAVLLFENLQKKGFICHASGDYQFSFIHGFYLYYIVTGEKEQSSKADSDSLQSLGDLELFQKEWFEVEVALKTPGTDGIGIPYAIPATPDWTQQLMEDDKHGRKLEFKTTNIDIDIGGKSDRVEWGHVRYHSIFRPGEAFEVEVQWMVATGNIIAELVQGWARKAGSCGLQVVPIPSDPFALPFSSKSDTLRGPIFIPFNCDCLPLPASQIQQEDSLTAFQELILQQFGFITHHNPVSRMSPLNQKQYVHISGSMFVMLPIRTPPPTDKSGRQRIHSFRLESQPVCSPHEDYITRHFSGQKKSSYHSSAGQDSQMGFLWSWNYMITKRWKTHATGDEQFMRKVMYDFRAFCANDTGRLRDFWDEYWMSDFQMQMLPVEN